MTKKDFIVIARALQIARMTMLERTYQSEMQWRRCVREIANECGIQNSRFSYARFYAACGYDPNDAIDLDNHAFDTVEQSLIPEQV